MSIRNKILAAAFAVSLVAAMGVLSPSAQAVTFFDFTVDASAYTGDDGDIFVADKMIGNYAEVITFGAGNTFNVALKWEAGQFVANDGIDQVLGTGLNNDYVLYALYEGRGTFNTALSGVTTFVTDEGFGGLNFYIDPAMNTSFTQPLVGTNPWTTGNSGDDILIATGTPLAGSGRLDPSQCGANGINCGSFGTSTTFELTVPDGTGFFVLPDPFYQLSFQSGQLNTFDVEATQIINGSMDVVFAPIPEPSTLVLFGLGLIGTAVAIRRKR